MWSHHQRRSSLVNGRSFERKKIIIKYNNANVVAFRNLTKCYKRPVLKYQFVILTKAIGVTMLLVDFVAPIIYFFYYSIETFDLMFSCF